MYNLFPSFCFVLLAWTKSAAIHLRVAARENRATSAARVRDRSVVRNWSHAFKMHREAHRNYRESVSRISRLCARGRHGPRRLSDYLNATICMRRRRARAWPRVTDELRPMLSYGGAMVFFLSDDYLIFQKPAAWPDRFNYTFARIANKYCME